MSTLDIGMVIFLIGLGYLAGVVTSVLIFVYGEKQ